MTHLNKMHGWAQRQVSYADALIREAAWLRLDLSGDDLPPLLADVGDGTGPFQTVEAYGRRLDQRGHQLFVCRDPHVERRMDNAGHWRQGDHGIALMILWRQQSNASRAEVDQLALDEAIERVLDRVRGLPTDHTHGDRFFSVAEDPAGIRVEYPDPRTILTPGDGPLAAGNAYTVLVRYTATDAFQPGA